MAAAGPLVRAFQVTGGPNHDAGGEDTPLALTELASFWPYGPKSMPGVSVGAVSTATGADVVVAPSAPGHSLKRFRFVPTAQFFQEVGAVRLKGKGASTINITGR